MANDQLIAYIKDQLEAGVSEKAVKEALAGVGWQEGDIREAIAEVKQFAPAESSPPPSQAAVPQVSRMTAAISQTPQTPLDAAPRRAAGEGGAPVDASTRDAEPSSKAAKPPTSFSQGAPIVTPDIFQPKDLPVFKSSAKTPEPNVVQETIAKSSSARRVRWLFPVVLGVAVAVSLAAAFWFALRTIRLRAEVSSLMAETAVNSAQISTLTKKNSDLEAELSRLKEERSELLTDLSAFVAPPFDKEKNPGASPPAEAVTLKGVLAGGDNGPFTLTTGRGVIFTIKNSSDQKAASVLKLLVGNSVQLTGMHVPGTKEITITTVNGSALQ